MEDSTHNINSDQSAQIVIATERPRGFFSRLAHRAGDKVLDVLALWPGRTAAMVTMPGDALMLLSGLALNNFGRVTAGATGLMANLPLVFFGDRKKNIDSTLVHLDAQDKSLTHRILNVWKFWRYPWEFNATVNLGQMATIAMLAGPDTASKAGEALQTVAMISQDQVRPGELACGVLGTTGFLIMYIRDQSTTATVRGIRSLKTEFNALSGFAKRRGHDLISSGNPVKNLKTAFNSAVQEISMAGPNTVAAKIFQVALVPYAVESVLLRDWRMVASCALYAGANWVLSKTSKRQVLKQQNA